MAALFCCAALPNLLLLGCSGSDSARSGSAGSSGSTGGAPPGFGGSRPEGGRSGAEAGGAPHTGGSSQRPGGSGTAGRAPSVGGSSDDSGGSGAAGAAGVASTSSAGGAAGAGHAGGAGASHVADAGSSGVAGAGGVLDPEAFGDCTIRVSSIALSPEIATVGILEWSADTEVSSAYVDFGRDPSRFEYRAPVNLQDADYRTLLLGMKPDTTYSYRIVVNDGACGSAVDTVTTGSGPVGLGATTVETTDASKRSGDFVVTTIDTYAVVLDGDGDFVWWYEFEDATQDLSRAHMAADGNSMWASHLNVAGGNGRFYRVGMDGQGGTETIEADVHHDFCVLPSGGVAYIAFDTDGVGTCDSITTRSDDGETTEIYRLRDDFEALARSNGEWCHSNAIHYVPSEDAFYLSVLNQNMVLKITRGGELVWALASSEIEQEVPGVKYLLGASWPSRHHGHHLTDDGTLLLFDNGSSGFFESKSVARRFVLDEDSGTATEIWSYSGQTGTAIMGDVQQLSNGNVLVTYSTAGVLDEASPAGELVQSVKLSSRGFGYADARSSLYGPPDRW